MAKPDVSAARVRELLDYDPGTGVFTRRLSNGRWKAGTVAGCTGVDGYTFIYVDGVQYRAHRLAWLHVHGIFPAADIDHINGLRRDNRIANLRDVSRKTNLQNIRNVRSSSTSGLLGAFRHKKSGLWRTSLKIDGKERSLGYFKTPEEAHRAYMAGRLQHYPGCASGLED